MPRLAAGTSAELGPATWLPPKRDQTPCGQSRGDHSEEQNDE